MKAKKWLVSGLAVAMLATAAVGFAACGETKHDTHVDANKDGKCDNGKEEYVTDIKASDIVNGIYICEPMDMGSGRGNAYNYLRFHEGGTFYYAFMAQSGANAGGSTSVVGNWKIVEEQYDFTFYERAKDTDPYNIGKFTVNSYVELTNFDGTPYENHMTSHPDTDNNPAVYDNKYPIINGNVYGLWYSNMKFTHELNNTDFTADNETEKVVAEFVKEAGAADSVKLTHKGTFEDYISDEDTIYRGTWTYTAATRTYTLKTSDNKTATLVVSADGTTAEYIDFKGGTQSLCDINSGAPVTTMKVLTTEENLGIAVTFTLTFKSDGTVTMTNSMNNAAFDVNAKWALDTSAGMPNIAFTDISSGTLVFGRGADSTVTFTWTGTLGQAGEKTLVFSMPSSALADLQPKPAVTQKKVLTTEENLGIAVTFTLTFKSDGTVTMTNSMNQPAFDVNAKWALDTSAGMPNIAFTDISSGTLVFGWGADSTATFTWTGTLGQAGEKTLVFSMPSSALADLQ